MSVSLPDRYRRRFFGIRYDDVRFDSQTNTDNERKKLIVFIHVETDCLWESKVITVLLLREQCTRVYYHVIIRCVHFVYMSYTKKLQCGMDSNNCANEPLCQSCDFVPMTCRIYDDSCANVDATSHARPNGMSAVMDQFPFVYTLRMINTLG